MNFDYTYIAWRGLIVFEPMIIVTNLFMLLCSIYYFWSLRKFDHNYAKHKALFILFIGVSGVFGSIAHAVHFQLGPNFLKVVLFLMNALSLLAIYYFFRASNQYFNNSGEANRKVVFVAGLWILSLLLITLYLNEFILVKVHAGLVLVYSLIVHFISHRKNDSGSRFIVFGILVSFLSIIVHSIKYSIHEWFNYKDISHVIMIVSLYFIYRGIKLNSQDLHLKDLALTKE